jgi:hypothetical protein
VSILQKDLSGTGQEHSPHMTKSAAPRSDKRIGAGASHALPPLPIRPNRRAHRNSEQQGDGKAKRADSDVFLRSDDFEE